MPRIIPGVPTNDESIPAFTDPEQEYDPETQQAIQDLIDRSQPWRQPAEAPAEIDWTQQSPEDYAAANPDHVLDFHNDPEALDAVLPQRPAPPWYHDSSHPQPQTRAASLMRVLAYAAMGGLAGRGGSEQMVAQSDGHRSGGVGVGFQYGLAAGQNLQNLALRRQQMREMSDYRQAQTNRINAQTAAIPQQQADLSKYRQARTGYVNAQSEKLKADAERLKRAPNDKLIHSYNADDGKVHFLFQKPGGQTYEKVSEQSFYEKPEKQTPPRPLLGHGHDGIYLIDPTTFRAHKVVSYPPNAIRRGTPAQFQKLDDWKNREWKKVQNDSLLSDDDKMQQLQSIQNHFERGIITLGGDVEHFDVRTGSSAFPAFNPAQGADAKDPLGIR
ncbi:MAG: hypothetical protein ACM3WP_24055 [Acidobacteriota bacterium]